MNRLTIFTNRRLSASVMTLLGKGSSRKEFLRSVKKTGATNRD